MAFKYSVSGLTLGFLGYDFSEEPEFILKAIKHAGFDGIDIFDYPNNRNAEQIRQVTDSLNLEVPEVLGNWEEGIKTRGKRLLSMQRKLLITVSFWIPRYSGFVFPSPVLPRRLFL